MALTTTPTVTITGDSNAVISGAESATITTANAFTFIITETGLTSGTLNWSANFGKNGATYTSVDNLDGTFTITATSLAHGLLIGSTPTITVASATNSQLNGSQTATITTAGAFTFIVTGTLITTGSLNWSAVLSGTTKAYTPVLIAVAGTMSAQFNCKGA
jgi:hypothetical protein